MNKPRLIDANELLDRLPYPTDYDELEFYGKVLDVIEELPTAYNIDEVVEQLVECSWWTPPTYDEDGYCNDDSAEVVDLDDAIEIVKKGGAE